MADVFSLVFSDEQDGSPNPSVNSVSSPGAMQDGEELVLVSVPDGGTEAVSSVKEEEEEEEGKSVLATTEFRYHLGLVLTWQRTSSSIESTNCVFP